LRQSSYMIQSLGRYSAGQNAFIGISILEGIH
jgi:hypothetical protein